MKIYYLHHLPFPWGRAHDVHVIKTVYYLAQEGVETYLLAPVKRGFSLEKLLTYYGLGRPPFSLKLIPLPALRKSRLFPLTLNLLYDFFLLLWFKLRGSSSDSLFFFSERRLSFLAYKLAPEKPRVFEIHGLTYFKRGVPLPEEAEALSRISLGLVTTRALRDLLQKIYRPPVPLRHLPLASEPLPGPPYTGPSRDPRLVYVGQLYPGQGVDLLLRALPQVSRGYLLIAGGGKELSALKKLARRLGIERRVEFLGPIPHAETRRLLLSADVLLLPALPEGKQPYVAHQKLYEYLGAGRPIVASDLPSIKEEVSQGEALLFEAGNSEALAEALNRILAEPELARRLAQQALKKACQYDWPARTRKLKALLKEVTRA